MGIEEIIFLDIASRSIITAAVDTETTLHKSARQNDCHLVQCWFEELSDCFEQSVRDTEMKIDFLFTCTSDNVYREPSCQAFDDDFFL